MSGESAALGSSGERFGQEAADDVAARSALVLGDRVDLGDGVGVEADGVDLTRHAAERITEVDNVIRRDTVLGMTTTQSTDSRKAALFARTSTAALVLAGLSLDAKGGEITAGERLTRAWICDELVSRMGGIQDDEAFDGLLDTDLSYVECLIVTFPELTA